MSTTQLLILGVGAFVLYKSMQPPTASSFGSSSLFGGSTSTSSGGRSARQKAAIGLGVIGAATSSLSAALAAQGDA